MTVAKMILWIWTGRSMRDFCHWTEKNCSGIMWRRADTVSVIAERLPERSREILESELFEKCKVEECMEALQGDSLLEKIEKETGGGSGTV